LSNKSFDEQRVDGNGHPLPDFSFEDFCTRLKNARSRYLKPKNEYGKRRAGFMKYQKCQLQLAAYALGLEHTIGVIPELCMTFVATKEISQVFVIQKGTIEKYKNKWRETVKKYYEVILPEQKEREIEMLGIDGDIM